MAKKLPTQRTLESFRSLGFTIGVVERWNPHVGPHGIRQDLFGFIDLIAFNEGTTIAIQATSTGNLNSRIKKILDNENARLWLMGPNRQIAVIGWKKYAKPVNRKFWRMTWRAIRLGDFNVTA